MTATNHDVLTVSWEMGPKLAAAGLVGTDGSVVTTETGARFWNGWAVPLFTAAQMDAVVAATAEAPERVEWRETADGDRTLVVVLDDGEEFPVAPLALADGTPVWGFDGWTWDIDA